MRANTVARIRICKEGKAPCLYRSTLHPCAPRMNLVILSFAGLAGQRVSCTGKKKPNPNSQGILFWSCEAAARNPGEVDLAGGFPAVGLTFGSRSAKCSRTTAKDLPFSAKWQGCGWRQQPSRWYRPCQGKQLLFLQLRLTLKSLLSPLGNSLNRHPQPTWSRRSSSFP